MNSIAEFQSFLKMARLNREIWVSEKIDGSNGCIFITPISKDSQDPFCLAYWYGPDASTWGLYAGSRNRWLQPGKSDNYGFAAWVLANVEELKKLGPGRHFGEWWGQGIQRNYGLTERRFSLFNVARWVSSLYSDPTRPGVLRVEKDEEHGEILKPGPESLFVVPVLWRGQFHSRHIENALENLRENGSYAAPGFMQPEGIVVFHTAAGSCFKVTLVGDDKRKSDLTSL